MFGDEVRVSCKGDVTLGFDDSYTRSLLVDARVRSHGT